MSWRLRQRLFPNAKRDVGWAAWGFIGVEKLVMQSVQFLPIDSLILFADKEFVCLLSFV